MRTRKEVRALRARSLLHVPLIRIFLRFDRDDDLQKAVGWFWVLVGGGVLRARAAECRANGA